MTDQPRALDGRYQAPGALPTDDIRAMSPAEVARLNAGGDTSLRDAFLAVRHRQDGLHRRLVRAGFPRDMFPTSPPRQPEPPPVDPGPPPPQTLYSRAAWEAWKASRDAWEAVAGKAPPRSYPDLGGGPRATPLPRRQPSFGELLRAAVRGDR